MLKQFQDKNKNNSSHQQIFHSESFNSDHPFSQNTPVSCPYAKGNCTCTCNKLHYYNHYVYQKVIRINGGCTILPLKRSVTDLDQNGMPVSIDYDVKNWRCLRFAKISAEKRKRQEAQLFHAYLPESVPKYGRFTYRFIFGALLDYVTRSNTSVRALCSRLSISVSTLYRWIHVFRAQFQILISEMKVITNEYLNPEINIEKITAITTELIHFFYLKTNGITFMEQSAWFRACRPATQ